MTLPYPTVVGDEHQMRLLEQSLLLQEIDHAANLGIAFLYRLDIFRRHPLVGVANMVRVDIVEEHEHFVLLVMAYILHCPVIEFRIPLVRGGKLVIQVILINGVYQRQPVPVIRRLDTTDIVFQDFENRGEIAVSICLHSLELVFVNLPAIVCHTMDLRSRT